MCRFDGCDNTPYTRGCALGKRALLSFGCRMKVLWLSEMLFTCRTQWSSCEALEEGFANELITGQQ